MVEACSSNGRKAWKLRRENISGWRKVTIIAKHLFCITWWQGWKSMKIA